MSTCRDAEGCVLTKAPTLVRLSKEYGGDVLESFVEIAINDLSEYAGCKNKLDVSQTEQIAKMIISEYSYLTMQELMLFFYRMKCGRYGEFYGSVDGMRIMSSIRKFIEERNTIIDRAEQERRAREFEESRKNAITREEYERLVAAGEVNVD